MYKKRTSRRPLAIRADELLTVSLSEIIARGLTDRMYNFEYYLNRPYAFNRDKGMCKVCGEMLWADNVQIHHVDPDLPLYLANRVQYLATTCKTCHGMIHDNKDYAFLDKKTWGKILYFREKLGKSHKAKSPVPMHDGTPDEVKVSCPV